MRQVAIVIVILAFIAGAAIVVRIATRRRPSGVPALEPVPPAFRPGDTDDVLESDRLNRIMRWGMGMVVFLAIFFPVYWFAEPGRMRAKETSFLEQSIDRGRFYFAMREDPETGERPPEGSGRPAGEPLECARCHGTQAEGGMDGAGRPGPLSFIDSRTGERRTTTVPELSHIFALYEKPPAGFRSAREYIKTTIERGRTGGVLGVGDDMPTWGVAFGGPLVEATIEDLVNYIESIQETGPPAEAGPPDGEAIFAQFCAPCHGAGGIGASAPAMTTGSEVAQFASVEEHVAFVKEGSKPGVPYGARGLGTGAMPAWGSVLTEEQIRAVVEYERSL